FLTDGYINDLAKEIGSEWETLALSLGLKKAHIDHIKEDHSGAINRIVAMLLFWRQRASCGDMSKLAAQLSQALCKADHTAGAVTDNTKTTKSAGSDVQSSDDYDVGVLSAPLEILARGPRALSAYAKTARDGTHKVYHTRLMLVGQERVGKTSLKNVLTGQRFNKDEKVTDGVETRKGCEISIDLATAGATWNIDQRKEETRKPSGVSYSQAMGNAIVEQLLPGSQETNQPEERGKDKTRVVVGRHPSEAEPSVGSSASPEVVSPSRTSEQSMPEPIATIVEKMLKKKAQLNSPPPNEMSLSIWDFAGQDVYYTTHQVFLTWRAVYIVVFDLSRDLDSVIPPESRDEYYTTAKGNSKSELTCLEFITFWLNSIFAHAVAPSTTTNSTQLQKSPPIFVVGTHRESVGDSGKVRRNKVEDAFEKIKNAVKNKPYQNHVIPRYYAVENRLGEADEQIADLRKHIERVAEKEQYMGQEMPINYLLFEEAVAAQIVNFISFEQVREIMRPFGMDSDEELVTMLHFYHDLGFIIYFGEKGKEQEKENKKEMEKEDKEEKETEASHLDNLVILQPQWLIDVFKQVITVLKHDRRDGIVSDAWTKLEDEGILQERLIDYMWQGCLEQKGFLVKLMEKFDLICKAPPKSPESANGGAETTKQYYVPSRLKSEDMEPATLEKSVECFVDFGGFFPDFLTDGYINDLAKEIGSEWETLALILGLKKAHIDHIKNDHSGAVNRIVAMLLLWRQRASCGDMSKLAAQLSQALCKADRTDLAQLVRRDSGIM
ncbi:probable serine/threonine-protein kinase roco8, partial [Diadema setosum]|uniref:probable serine/threonine-protein kinase roco8 n=1 Tax=Diadema setosum TaxID=31175 RepID=UPI003B3A83A4